jgi:hypothetical protein
LLGWTMTKRRTHSNYPSVVFAVPCFLYALVDVNVV